jgi:hypothetical protein
MDGLFADGQFQSGQYLTVGDLVPEGPGVMPYGIDHRKESAIKALRDLANAMENGRACIQEVQLGQGIRADDWVTYVVHLEYAIHPF